MAQIEEIPGGDLAKFGSAFYALEVKGCKAYTKEMVDDNSNTQAEGALKCALENLRSYYSALDWEYMLDRKRGELFLDIGVTYTPQHRIPVIGLWRLDSLEASYGAGGYTRGTMHTINTMGKYCGIQAEMAKQRMERTHISFRQSYNLTYEAVRRNSNSRDLFVAKDIYSLDTSYLQHRERVLRIYREKAPKKTYGVHDEFRVGGAAIEDIVRDIDLHVSPYIRLHLLRWTLTCTID